MSYHWRKHISFHGIIEAIYGGAPQLIQLVYIT